MNRKDFFRTLAAGAVVAPVVAKAINDPTVKIPQSLPQDIIEHVGDIIRLKAEKFSYYNEYAYDWQDNFKRSSHVIGRTVTVEGIDLAHLNELVNILVGRDTKEFTIYDPIGSATFTGFVDQVEKTDDGVRINVICTTPNLELRPA